MIHFKKYNRRKILLKDRLANIRDLTLKIYFKSRKFIFAAAVTIFLIFISMRTYIYLDTSPYFKLVSLEIHGNETLSGEDVQRTCGLEIGNTDLLFLDTGDVEKKCEKHLWINQAKVVKNLPSEITVIVKEEKPAALTSYGGMYLTNIYGEMFMRVEPPEYYDYPWITGIQRIVREEGEEAGISAIRDVLSLINDYMRNGLEKYDRIRSVHVNPLTGMRISLANSGLKIMIGHPPFTKKMKRLDILLEELSFQKKTADYILLNNRKKPYQVTIKFSNNEEEEQK
jgi:cell division septal protein FtsQ